MNKRTNQLGQNNYPNYLPAAHQQPGVLFPTLTTKATTHEKCNRCGRTLDESEFGKNKRHKDGLQTWCRECTNEYMREKRWNNTPPPQCKKEERMDKVFSNLELARFTPRELINELKARGYSGQLKYTHTINL